MSIPTVSTKERHLHATEVADNQQHLPGSMERHIHATQDTDALLRRLKRIEGQVRGVQKMVEEGRYCLDILTQLQAITAASEKVGQQILEGHIRGCIADAIKEERGDAAITELMQVLGKALQR